jgi:hypothetical protein
MKVLKTKELSLEVQVKGNPFVSVVPTFRTFRLVEKSDKKFLIRIMTKNKDIPYCDTFETDEEWYCASTETGSNSCVLRSSFKQTFLKFTMMKSIISSQTLSETKAFWAYYKTYLFDRGFEF